MSKGSNYFSHDYNTRSDEKVKLLIRKHGMLGYGVFWSIVEDLYQNENSLLADYEGIAYDLRTDAGVVESIILDFGLFVINDKKFGSLSVQRRIDERIAKSELAKKSISQRWSKKQSENTDFSKSNNGSDYYANTNVLHKEYERNTINESKEKESKEKESKVVDESTTREAPPASSPPFGKVVMTSDNNFLEKICDESESEFQNLCKKNGLLGDFNSAAADFYKTQKALDKTWTDFGDFKRHFWNVVLKNIGKSPPRETPDERMRRERKESGRTLKVNFIGSKKVE